MLNWAMNNSRDVGCPLSMPEPFVQSKHRPRKKRSKGSWESRKPHVGHFFGVSPVRPTTSRMMLLTSPTCGCFQVRWGCDRIENDRLHRDSFVCWDHAPMCVCVCGE